ncbi:outer membrane beta-barrel protein [Algoriphagus sp. AGSA1]|uniref:outer membrane beta-barrel protein n=1 Tax=Algoriphagus sp. AGSA1 TaxID=2907213 RepID=UPI001F1CEA23|nr:outer membrane beta-barrel protein [Algoriphagus sp. AGSA1]MCE7053495.1 outer membrane beta-barrel protein [Algoriphagus sp. AGSA1]
MKEDKLDKEIAASLKKKLAEASVPYQIGAWESFQKKRKATKYKSIATWVTGIAASLILLGVGLNSAGLFENENADLVNIQLSTNEENPAGVSVETTPVDTLENRELLADSPIAKEEELSSTDQAPDEPAQINKAQSNEASQNPSGARALAIIPQTEEKPTVADLKSAPKLSTGSDQKSVDPSAEKVEVQMPELIAQVEKAENPNVTEPTLVAETEEKQNEIKQAIEENLVKAKDEKAEMPDEMEKMVAENEIPSIPKDKMNVGLGVGVSPGFGSLQNDNQVAVASSVGLGMLVDIKLPGKLILGSGLGVNYLSQNAEKESTVMAFGNSFPQTEKLEVRQMQVEVPVFIKYPLTRSNSISIQAGFSNFYALNETASQENTVERQMAHYNNDVAGLSSVSLKQEAVTQSASLESTGARFYPFATLNFGLNFRVLETKGANYVVMPFYNYQVRQVSGYGNTFGLFGASLKLNFGGGEK